MIQHLLPWVHHVSTSCWNNNSVFTGIFTCQRVTCEDAGLAAYSQLCLHVTGEYNRQQAGISRQNHRNVAHRPVYTQWVSFVLAHVLAKVRNFEQVASKTQRVHATAFSHLHIARKKRSVYTRQHLAVYTSVASKNAGVQRVKTPVKTLLLTVLNATFLV